VASERHAIALIPGDGIGADVTAAATRVLDACASRFGFSLHYETHDWGCDRYLAEGAMMPNDGLDRLRGVDAILLGAVGRPDVPDDVSLWGLLIPIRRGFRQYVNLRPMRILAGLESPLRGVGRADLDLVIVRENNEGEYSEIGGRAYQGTPEELAMQQSTFTRRGVERLIRFGCELARARSGRITAATKSNGIIHTMPFWDQLFAEQLAATEGLDADRVHIDALAAMLVLKPEQFDVIVASNLFGDILSDLAAAVAGSIGVAPSANLNPERDFPSMFEPVHGSAPDIAGRGIANPVGAIWSGALLLEHLGHPEAASSVLEAIEAALASGVRTPDLGGTATTADVTKAVVHALRA
jgi:tartrate dehydrogenase/decarboxylase/D-malate dehydrogenase